MGISVNASVLPASTAISGNFSAAAQDVALIGDFAGLLSQELNNFLFSPAVPATELANNTTSEDAAKDPLLPQSADVSTLQIDPSLIASLNAVAQTRPNSPPPPPEDTSLSIEIPTGSKLATTTLPAPDDANAQKLLSDTQTLDLKKQTFNSIIASASHFPPETKEALAEQSPNPSRLIPTSTSANALTASPQYATASSHIISHDLQAATPTIEATVSAPAQPNISTQHPVNLDHIESKISPHLRDMSWSQSFGDQVVWITKSAVQSAQISINPPELGQMQITLSLTGDQAKLSFASPHLEVRQAIESAMPHLKEMLSLSGINLGQANVGAHLPQQQRETPPENTNGKRIEDENAILREIEGTLTSNNSAILQRGRGLVDLFA